MKVLQKSLMLFALLFTTIVYAQESSYTYTSTQEVYAPLYRNDGANKKVKNVILMVGDGMGLAHMTSALHANRGALTIANMRHIGLVKTQSQNRYITDSAASGTAYATGYKTDNGKIGVDSENNPLSNMTEILAARGYTTGIITTDKIVGATPSAFYAHQRHRSMNAEILSDLIKTHALFIAGSGIELFDNPKVGGGKLDSLRAAGFGVIHDFKSLPSVTEDKIALIANKRDAEWVQNGRDTDYLRYVTEFAIDFLDSKAEKGFFMMVEGAEIDHAAHAGNTEGVIRETLDFDKAVAEALRFADENGETLVIVVADHETGGMALGDGDIATGNVQGRFTTGGHSAILVPVYAYGPQSSNFCGVIDNTEIFKKILSALRVKQ